MINRREFIAGSGAVTLGALAVGCDTTNVNSLGTVNRIPAVSGESNRLLIENPRHPNPAPVGVDRLPLEWHQERVRVLPSDNPGLGIEVNENMLGEPVFTL